MTVSKLEMEKRLKERTAKVAESAMEKVAPRHRPHYTTEVLAASCSSCSADAGSPCVTPKGRARKPHSKRS